MNGWFFGIQSSRVKEEIRETLTATTTQLARQEDAQGFDENLSAAKRGGRAAGVAREGIEAEIGKSVVTGGNFLPKQQQRPLIELGDE